MKLNKGVGGLSWRPGDGNVQVENVLVWLATLPHTSPPRERSGEVFTNAITVFGTLCSSYLPANTASKLQCESSVVVL